MPKPQKKKRILINTPRIQVGEIDWKKPETFSQFLTEKGKIRSRFISGTSIKDQKRISNAVKNAREMALIPYKIIGEPTREREK